MTALERASLPADVGNRMERSTPNNHARAISISKKGQGYTPLEQQFQRGGFDHKQIVRQGDAAIYSQTWPGSSEPVVAFEVVCIRRHNGKEIKGQSFEPSEFYPSSTDWGKYGFTFTDNDAAFAKLRELSQRSQTNVPPVTSE